MSLSIDASKRHASAEKHTEDPEEYEFSTILTADSDCCLGDNPGVVATNKVSKKRKKENQHDNSSHSSMNDKTSNVGTKCDVVDLCDLPCMKA